MKGQYEEVRRSLDYLNGAISQFQNATRKAAGELVAVEEFVVDLDKKQDEVARLDSEIESKRVEVGELEQKIERLRKLRDELKNV
jgi:prefoldin subunit 5